MLSARGGLWLGALALQWQFELTLHSSITSAEAAAASLRYRPP